MTRLLTIFLLLTFQLEAGWLERKAEGWAWYEDEEKREKKEIFIPEEIPALTATEELEAMKKNLELKLAEAILQPTQENIVNYMNAQKEVIRHSAVFATEWGKVLLQNPELDPTATSFATTHYGRQLQKNIEREENEKLIASVAKDYGLFFLYEGNSRSSKAFANVVKIFGEKYHWEIVGIPVDGVELPEITVNAKSDIADQLGVEVFPALIAFDPRTKRLIPLAFGLKAMDQIENNVVLQFKE
jgi:conjugal transfer pilus assembly protein TraF